MRLPGAQRGWIGKSVERQGILRRELKLHAVNTRTRPLTRTRNLPMNDPDRGASKSGVGARCR